MGAGWGGQVESRYRQAEGVVLRCKSLHDYVHSALQVIRGKLKLEIPRFVALPGYRRVENYKGSRIQVCAADDRTGDGVIFRLAITDELHRQRTLELYRTWVGKRCNQGWPVVVSPTSGEPETRVEDTCTSTRKDDAHRD